MPVTSQCLVSKKLVELHTRRQEFKLYVPIVKHSHTVILTRFNTLSLNYRWCQCALSFSVLQWDWNLKRPFWHLYITVKKYFFLFTETSFILLTMLKNNFVRTILLQLCWLIYFCNGESEVAFTVFSVTGSFRNSDMLIVTLLSMVLPNIFV